MTVKVYSPVLPSVEVFGAHEGIASATGINQTVSLTFTPTEGTLVVVPYGDTVGQLQLEVGPTPSSYIPTAGATATRAAETLTVPAENMPWPTPVVIGEELVTNGTFDTDISGWTASTGATVTHDTNKMKVAQGTSNDFVVAYQAITTVVGKTYTLSYDAIDDGTSTSGAVVYVRTQPTSGNIVVFSDGFGANSGTFTATTTTTYISAGLGTSSDNVYAIFDNISVKEINPLSVSIQMDGLMTYADEDLTTQSQLVSWLADSDNSIRIGLTTGGALPTSTGDIDFVQRESAITDRVDSRSNLYSPGINVPFNIASRHGSTFINGAVGGTALTANTTPTALPDLSTTDFDIGPTYMGTIGKLRVWSDDIGDTGISEAST